MEAPDFETLKRCPCCGRELPTSCFYTFPRDGGKLSCWCKPCNVQRLRDHRETRKGEGSRPPPARPYEVGLYRDVGSVRLADDLPETVLAEFFAKTHSKKFLLSLAMELGIVER